MTWSDALEKHFETGDYIPLGIWAQDNVPRMEKALRMIGYSAHTGLPRFGDKAQTARWGLGEDALPNEYIDAYYSLGGAASRAERFADTGDTDVLLEGLDDDGLHGYEHHFNLLRLSFNGGADAYRDSRRGK